MQVPPNPLRDKGWIRPWIHNLKKRINSSLFQHPIPMVQNTSLPFKLFFFYRTCVQFFPKTIAIFLKYSIQNSSLFRVNSLNFITIHLQCLSFDNSVFPMLFSQLLVRSEGSFLFSVSFQKAEWNTLVFQLPFFQPLKLS